MLCAFVLAHGRYYELRVPKYGDGYVEKHTFTQAHQHRAACRVLAIVADGEADDAMMDALIKWERWLEVARWERQPGQMTTEVVGMLRDREKALFEAFKKVLPANRMESVKLHSVIHHQADDIQRHGHPVNSDTGRWAEHAYTVHDTRTLHS